MKLLIEENMLPRLVAGLADAFQMSVHVRDAGLDRATDAAIWAFLVAHHRTSISKDSDFHQMTLVLGPWPEVIWIRRGNCTTADIETLLRSNRAEILAFGPRWRQCSWHSRR